MIDGLICIYLSIYLGSNRWTCALHCSTDSLDWLRLFPIPRRSAYRLCARTGIKMQALTKPSRHLEYDHPDMEQVRIWVRSCEQDHGVHPRLICNFDQVCSMHFQHSKSALHKSQSQQGQHPAPFCKPTMKKMLDTLRAALDLAHPNATSVEEDAYEAAHPLTNADASTVSVDYARQCRTTTTLSWCDGDVGCAYVTATTTSMPAQTVEKLNKELQGESWLIFLSGYLDI